ncbi:MAG: 5-formyltetrahydrofolate cyclo-ligase [Sphingomonadales bacterium]|nr:5-formyltetrahydrofolate cyclo-ligase [Sphingomonadales bacterium]
MVVPSLPPHSDSIEGQFPERGTVPFTLDKTLLRERLRAERRAFARSLPPDTRGAMEQALADALAPEWLGARVVAAYQPMKDEIDPTAALAAARTAGCETALPAFVERDSRMTFHGGPVGAIGPWGIPQPSLDAPALAPDLLLVPVVAVDRAGNRVGQGKGHYDRALAQLREAGPVRLIGVGWAMQLLDTPLVPDPWDVPLDAFASPDGMIEFQ